MAITAHTPQHKGPYKKGPLTRWLEDQGFEVLRFWNHQVLTETEAVLQAVANALAPTRPA